MWFIVGLKEKGKGVCVFYKSVEGFFKFDVFLFKLIFDLHVFTVFCENLLSCFEVLFKFVAVCVLEMFDHGNHVLIDLRCDWVKIRVLLNEMDESTGMRREFLY